MPHKKNKSSIKYGNYIYNELKEKRKTKNTNNISLNSTNFLTMLGTLVNQYRRYFLPVFTLGGYPIDDSAYDRNTNIVRRHLVKYLTGYNELIDYSYYDINKDDDDINDYLLLCDTQDTLIEESFKDYEVTEDEFLDSVCGINQEAMQKINDFYDTIIDNPYTVV